MFRLSHCGKYFPTAVRNEKLKTSGFFFVIYKTKEYFTFQSYQNVEVIFFSIVIFLSLTKHFQPLINERLLHNGR